jgi:hypothetical protein
VSCSPMAEPEPGRSETPIPDDEFERYLFAQIAAKELDFPKCVLVPLDEADAAPRVTSASRDGWYYWRRGLGALLPRPALAYLLLVALALPAYRGLFPQPPTPTPEVVAPAVAPTLERPQPGPGLGNARVLDLRAGPTRSRGAAGRIALGGSDAFIVLSFLVPIRSGPGIEYEAVLRDASGQVVAAQKPLASTDGLGHFVLVCDSRLFPGGDYELTVAALAPEVAAPAEEYRFPFHVSRSER